MNTCQTSIKPILKCSVAVAHIGSTRKTRDHHSGSQQADQKVEIQADEHCGLSNTYRRSKLLKLSQHSINMGWTEYSTNLSAFLNRLLPASPIPKFGIFGNRQT